jgi:hypothetical protein
VMIDAGSRMLATTPARDHRLDLRWLPAGHAAKGHPDSHPAERGQLLAPLSWHDQAAFVGNDDQLRPVPRVQLGQDPAARFSRQAGLCPGAGGGWLRAAGP